MTVLGPTGDVYRLGVQVLGSLPFKNDWNNETLTLLGAIAGGVVGGIPMQYILNGVPTNVTRDTVVPANNRPIPVELMALSGNAITINAPNMNLDVQLTHAGVDYDSIRIGNGTNLWGIDATNNGYQTLRVGANPIQTDILAAAAQFSNAGYTNPSYIGINAMLGWDITNTVHKEITLDANGNLNLLADILAALGGAGNVMELRFRTAAVIDNIIWTVILNPTTVATNKLDIFNSTDQVLELSLDGGATSNIYIPLGGNGEVGLDIPAGSNLVVKAIDAATTTGELIINFFS
jgi:hypothetical protein